MATSFDTKVGNGEYRLQFETDNREYYLLMQSTARRCVDGGHTTNADRIRAMSDAELAKILNAFTAYFEDCNRSVAGTGCYDCELFELCSLGEGKAIDWLKQPAKGE